jgi:hypothetical protein
MQLNLDGAMTDRWPDSGNLINSWQCFAAAGGSQKATQYFQIMMFFNNVAAGSGGRGAAHRISGGM